MTWFLVDDNFYDHPKVMLVSLEAIGLWTLAGSWSGRYLTEGVIPKRAIGKIGGTEALAQQLVDAGLWLDNGDSWRFHDWTDSNPTKEQVISKREKRAEAGRRGGLASGEARRSRAEAKAQANAEANTKQKPKQNTNENEPNTNTNTFITTPLPPSQGEEDFERFYQTYPKHTDLDKAKPLWDSLIEHGLADPETLIAAADVFAKTMRAESKPMKFIPSPARWLHAGTWQDYQPKPNHTTISDAWIQDNLTLKLPHGTDPWEARRTLINLTKTGTPKEQAAQQILNQTRKENQ